METTVGSALTLNPVELLSHYGLPLVFAAVLAEQLGLPLPAAPILICAGALAAGGTLPPEQVLLAGLLGCMLADHAWFHLGRRYGRRLLAGLCRVSLSPDTCVRQTDTLVGRHGPALLLVAKFVPGVSAVSIPTAAAGGLRYARFLRFDTAGALLWVGAYLALGMIFDREVNRLLDTLERYGSYGLVLCALALLAYIGARLFYRWRLRQLYRIVRISAEETHALLRSEPGLVLFDARTPLARSAPEAVLLRGAVLLENGDLLGALPHEARGSTIVTFCSCPNEASAALLARRLMNAGFERVRVLSGGVEALAAVAAMLDAGDGSLTMVEAVSSPASGCPA